MQSSSPIYSLVYISSSTGLLDETELQAILRISRHNNSHYDVTGMLLYYEGAFIQVLEGEEAAVRGLYAKIMRDARHHGVIRLLEERLPQRNFPEWSMGYYRLHRDELAQLEGFSSGMETADFMRHVQADAPRSYRLLRSFHQTARRAVHIN